MAIPDSECTCRVAFLVMQRKRGRSSGADVESRTFIERSGVGTLVDVRIVAKNSE